MSEKMMREERLMIEYLEKSCEGHSKTQEKFEKAVCPCRYNDKGKECKFFEIYRKVTGDMFQNEGSIFSITPIASECRFQYEHERKSEKAPVGLLKKGGCVCEDDRQPMLHLDNYLFFNR